MDYDFTAMRWRAIPSINIITKQPPGKPVTYSILTDGKWGGENTPVILASGLCEEVANYIVNSHNIAIAR